MLKEVNSWEDGLNGLSTSDFRTVNDEYANFKEDQLPDSVEYSPQNSGKFWRRY